MTRDMTSRQFFDALVRRSMHLTGVLGYVEIGHGVSVCRFNAGRNLRAQLAYLIQQQDRVNAEWERDHPTEQCA